MASSLSEVVFVRYNPDRMLIKAGKLPDGWKSAYRASLADAVTDCADEQGISPQTVDAVHWVSFHLWFRYLSWASASGGSNPDTEASLGSLQFESELFFCNSLPLLGRLDEEPLPGDEAIRHHEREIIRLSLYDNKLLLLPEVDQVKIDQWTEEYRLHVTAIRQSWTSDRVWNAWAVQAIRFASIYLGVALLPEQGKVVADRETGVSPERIAVVVERLRQVLPASTVELISRWLRLAHLRRSSEGIPSVLVPYIPSRRVRVRTVSEAVLQSGRLIAH